MNVTKILVPIDFSEHSEVALGFASKLARDSDAEIHLVHVSEQPLPITEGFAGYAPASDLAAEREHLHGVKPEGSIQHRHELLIGDAAQVLVDYARDNAMDLIVMGTHGRTGFSRLLMGSVAEAVVRQAPCPVLTLRQPVNEPHEQEA